MLEKLRVFLVVLEARKRRGRVYTKDKKTSICSTAKRLETFGAVRADFLMCGIGSEAHGFPTPAPFQQPRQQIRQLEQRMAGLRNDRF